MPDESDLQTARSARREPGALRLFAGIVIAPLAWALQVLIGYGLAAHACYPADAPLSAPLWPGLRAIVGGSSILLWLLLLAGCAIAWRNWKATRPPPGAGTQMAVEAAPGRERFMALSGLMVSGLFAVVQLFTSAGIPWVPSCGA